MSWYLKRDFCWISPFVNLPNWQTQRTTLGKWHFNMTTLLAWRASLHPWLLWLLACWRHEQREKTKQNKKLQLALVAANRVCTQETHTRETTNHKHENETCPGTQTEYSTEPKWSRTTALTSHGSPNWNWTELRWKPSATSWIQHVRWTKYVLHHVGRSCSSPQRPL